MALANSFKRVAFALLVIGLVPTSVIAAEDEQEDRQEHKDRQEDLSANNTAFKGATLLSRGEQAYVESVNASAGGQKAEMFWSGDTLNFEVRSEETGNRVALKMEF
ncbi:MAG: hypothetical protein ABEN55_20675, partial [Bradymonadaceae bacterium]